MFQGFVSLKQEASQKAEWLRSAFYYSVFVVNHFQWHLPYKPIAWQQNTTALQKEKKPPGYTNHTGGKLLTDDSNLPEGFKPKEWSCVASISSTTDFQVTAEIARPSTKNRNMKMPIGRNVSQGKKKKSMKIVQDLPWNTEDLKSGREQTDATSPCLAYQKRCAKSSMLLKTNKWLHNPETDCQYALPAFAWNCPSLIWSLPCSEAAVGGHAFARMHTQTPPWLLSLEPALVAKPGTGPACTAHCSGGLWECAPGHHPETHLSTENAPVKMQKRMPPFYPTG